MNDQKLEVRYVSTDTLIPYCRNARVHSPEQVQRIASSIKEFGFNNPILVDGEKGVIAGHGRLAAAQLLGLKEVPTIQLDGMTDAQKRAYILADNRIALDSTWDTKLLSVEAEALKEAGIDIELTGFSDDEINELVSGWCSDIPEIENQSIPSSETTKIVVQVAPDAEVFAREAIENALQSAGISYEL